MKRKLLLIALLPLMAACASATLDCFPPQGAKDVNPDTHLVLNFPDTPVVGNSGCIRIFDAANGKEVDCLDLSKPAGLTRGRIYGPDCHYINTPYDYSRDVVATNRNTVPGTPSHPEAEPTPNDMQLTIIGGFSDGFRFYPVLVRGNSAVIYPHNNMLEYGHRYYVTIDEGAISCGDFKGVGERKWTFTTKRKGPADMLNLTVDASGSGDFNTVQGALDAVPDFSKETVTINVAAGDYEEIVYFRNKSNVVIKGAGMDATKVHYANCEVFNPHPLKLKTNEKAGTFPSRRAAFAIDNCTDITLQDITVATDCFGQAEGLLVNGERIKLINTRVYGSGDALQANGTVYMEGGEIEGDGDTILGRGSLFCYKTRLINHGGPFSWVRNFKPAHGDVFVECSFESNRQMPADWGRSNLNGGSGYPDAEFVVINCTTRNFNPLGWSSIGFESATMLEYNTIDAETGKPADVSQRQKWSRQLDAVKDAETIANYSNPAYVLNGWNPTE